VYLNLCLPIAKGLGGYLTDVPDIDDCYAWGNVTGVTGAIEVGGFFGTKKVTALPSPSALTCYMFYSISGTQFPERPVLAEYV